MRFIMKARQSSRLTHQLTGGDEMDEFAEGVAFGFPVRLQTAEGGLIGKAEGAAEGVGEEAVGEVLREEVGVLDEVGADVGRAVDGLATILAGGVDGRAVRVSTAEVAEKACLRAFAESEKGSWRDFDTKTLLHWLSLITCKGSETSASAFPQKVVT